MNSPLEDQPYPEDQKPDDSLSSAENLTNDAARKLIEAAGYANAEPKDYDPGEAIEEEPFDDFPDEDDMPDDPAYKPDLQQIYDAFNAGQQDYAEGLLDYALGNVDQDEAWYLQRKYDYLTDKPDYLEPEKSQAVYNWVFDKIDEDLVDLSRVSDINPDENPTGEVGAQEAELVLLDLIFKRYDKVLRIAGHGPDEDTFLRVYPVIRNIFRSAGTIAKLRGDDALLEKWQKRWQNFTTGTQETREAVANYEPEYQTREELYLEFRQHPERQELWDNARSGVLVEDSYGETYSGDMTNIPARELVSLAERMRNALPEDYWGILAETSPTGKSWLEALPQLNDSARHGVNAFMDMLIPDNGYAIGGGSRKWQTAVEIGAKNASLTEWISFEGEERHPTDRFFVRVGHPVAKDYVVIEPNPILLDQAQDKLKDRDHIKYLQSDMTNLPLEAESVDLVVGDRSLVGLHGQTAQATLSEVARVLQPGGIFIDGAKPLDTSRIDSTISNRWKNLLAQMIADTARGTVGVTDGLSYEDESQLVSRLGLKKYTYNLRQWGTVVNAYVKEGSLEDAGYHAVPGEGVSHLLTINRTN